MEKKKWLWKRKSSSEKSAGESESSGSMCSHAENCTEEHQEFAKGSPEKSIHSPEVKSRETGNKSQEEKNSTSDSSLLKKFSEADEENVSESKSIAEVRISDGSPKSIGQLEPEENTASSGEEESERVRLLKEKLSAALINVSLKEEVVKQHTKFAEEAVAGWEKAEDEVASLKQQLDTTVQENSSLEARLGQLDKALKECVRQLRLAKEEHDRKISEALAEKNKEYHESKLKLESQIIELQAQVEASSANPFVVTDPGILLKLEFLESENQTLKNEIMSQSEELEIRTIERDLSTKAAEAASKQNLESIKMVAKLESECRKLKALSHKAPSFNKGHIQKSPSIVSYSIDSVTNSQSDGCQVRNSVEASQSEPSETSETARSDSWATALMAELDQFRNERSLGRSPPSSSLNIDLMDDFLEMERLAAMPENGHAKLESPKHPSKGIESQLREELKEITCRAAELEEKLRKLELEKAELEMYAAQTQMCLENSQVELIKNKTKLEGLEAELQEANELKMEFESYANDLKLEAKAMMSKIELLREEIDMQRISSEKLSSRCQELEYDLDGKNKELELQRDAASRSKFEEKEKALAKSQKRLDELHIQIEEVMMNLEKQRSAFRTELDEKGMALSESRKRLDELQIQLKEAEMKLEKQNAAYNSELEEKEMALAQSQMHFDELQTQLKESAVKLEKLKVELDGANESKERLLSELGSAREKVGSMSEQIDSLREQIEKEQAISAELSAKCEELKEEVKQKEQQLQLQQNKSVHIEQKINQEDVASAAGKLSECQKTIAALGNQLKSLATLEGFFIDTASITRFAGSAPPITNGSNEMWKLHSNNVYLTQKKRDGHLQNPKEGFHTFSKRIDGDMIESSSNMFSYSRLSGNGYEKLFPMRRSLEIEKF